MPPQEIRNSCQNPSLMMATDRWPSPDSQSHTFSPLKNRGISFLENALWLIKPSRTTRQETKYCNRTLRTTVRLWKCWHNVMPSQVDQLDYLNAMFVLIQIKEWYTHSNRIRWFGSSTSRHEASSCSSDTVCHVTRAASAVAASAWEAAAE
jgi:hypothetical protein